MPELPTLPPHHAAKRIRVAIKTALEFWPSVKGAGPSATKHAQYASHHQKQFNDWRDFYPQLQHILQTIVAVAPNRRSAEIVKLAQQAQEIHHKERTCVRLMRDYFVNAGHASHAVATAAPSVYVNEVENALNEIKLCVQSLPTAEGLPTSSAESCLRAIEAVLKAHHNPGYAASIAGPGGEHFDEEELVDG